MEDYTKNLEKMVQTKSEIGASSASNKWHFLIIGDRGKVLSFKRLKGFFLCIVVCLLISFFISGYYGFLYLSNSSENKKLKEQVDLFEERDAKLKKENELLLARAVVAESKLRENNEIILKLKMERKEESPSLEPFQPETAKKGSHSLEVKQTGEGTPKSSDNMKLKTEKAKLSTLPAIAVKDFEVGEVFKQRSIWVKFIVRKTSPSHISVSGNCLVVLKTDATDSEKWISLPDVPLSEGNPVGNKGQFFKMANFKPFRLKTQPLRFTKKVTEATIYVFSSNGDILFKEIHPVDLELKVSDAASDEKVEPPTNQPIVSDAPEKVLTPVDINTPVHDTDSSSVPVLEPLPDASMPTDALEKTVDDLMQEEPM